MHADADRCERVRTPRTRDDNCTSVGVGSRVLMVSQDRHRFSRKRGLPQIYVPRRTSFVARGRLDERERLLTRPGRELRNDSRLLSWKLWY